MNSLQFLNYFALSNRRILRLSTGVFLPACLTMIIAVFNQSVCAEPEPIGPSGSWQIVFQDEFDGDHLDTAKWNSTWFNMGGTMNGVSTAASNVTVSGGEARLQLSTTSTGALIHTYPYNSPERFAVSVGDFIEARVWFPGNGSQIFNWSAWWINSTKEYPSSGEHDIAEALGGKLKVVYHDKDKNSIGSFTPPGYWGGAWHTYGIHRKLSSANVYWDGDVVRTYNTNDDGRPVDVILNIGVRDGSPTSLGSEGALRIDYVRAWRPLSKVDGAIESY